MAASIRSSVTTPEVGRTADAKPKSSCLTSRRKAIEVPTTPDKLAKALTDLSRRRVLVGIPAGESPREGGTITNAAIGYINEFGSPAANIPARPHLVPGVQNALPAVTKYFEAAARAALAGNTGAVDTYFEQAGQKAVDSVKSLIRSQLKPLLAESTVKARRLRRPDIHYRVRMQIVDAVEAAKGTPRGSPARLLLAQLRERYNLGKQVYLRKAQTPEEATPLLDTSNYINSITSVVTTEKIVVKK
jgi:hypothetical protein